MNIIRTATIFSPYLPKYIARRRRPVTDFATSVTTCIRRWRISTDSFISTIGTARPYRTKITTSPRYFSFDKTAILAEDSTPICLDRFSVRRNSTRLDAAKAGKSPEQCAGIDEKIKAPCGRNPRSCIFRIPGSFERAEPVAIRRARSAEAASRHETVEHPDPP